MSWLTTLGNALSPLADALEVIGSLIAGAAFAWSFFHRRQKRLEKIQQNLESALWEMRKENDELSQDLEAQRELDAQTWLMRAERECRDGNNDRAAELLRKGSDKTREQWSELYYERARHSVTIVPQTGWVHALLEARSHARIAHLLHPENKARGLLLEEIDACIAMERVRAVESPVDDDHKEPAQAYLEPNEDEPEPLTLLAALNAQRSENREAGRYVIAERLAWRARQVARRIFSEQHNDVHEARYNWADALHLNGLAADGLNEIDAVLKLRPTTDPRVARENYSYRKLRVALLSDLNRYAEAVGDLERLIQDFDREMVGAEEHVDLRIRKVKLLGLLDADACATEAAAAIPELEQVCKEGRRDRIGRRHELAQLLNLARRNEEALTQIQQVIEEGTAERGEEHPRTLAAHYLKARILAALRRPEEALRVVDLVLPIQTRLLGAEHPLHTLATRHVRVMLLASLGRQVEAMDEIEALLPALTRIRGESHAQTLIVQTILCEGLLQLRRFDDALREIDAALDKFDSADRSELWQKSRQLKARCLFELGRDEEGVSYVDSVDQQDASMSAISPNLILTRIYHIKMLDRLGHRELALEKANAITAAEIDAVGSDHSEVRAFLKLREKLGMLPESMR